MIIKIVKISLFVINFILLFCTCLLLTHITQVLQLTATSLPVALVESFLTMLDAEELSSLSSAAQIKELGSTPANTMKM